MLNLLRLIVIFSCLLLPTFSHADVVYRNGSKLFGQIISLDYEKVIITDGCNNGSSFSIPLNEVKYILFDNRCEENAIRPSFGGGDEASCISGVMQDFYIIIFSTGEGCLCSSFKLTPDGKYVLTDEKNGQSHVGQKTTLTEFRRIKLCSNSKMYRNLIEMSKIPD